MTSISRASTNICAWSNTIQSPPWVMTDINPVGGQSDPLGSTDAWLLTCTGEFGGEAFTSSMATPSKDVCLSAYIKAGTSPIACLYIANTTKVDYEAMAGYNLITGVATNLMGLTIVQSSMIPLPNGWWRCWVNAMPVYGVLVGVISFFSVGESQYLYNMQINKGLQLGDALVTTEVPRS